MEISNEIMLALIGALMLTLRIIEGVTKKIFGNGKKTSDLDKDMLDLLKEIREYTKELHRLHSITNEDGVPVFYFPVTSKKQIERIEELSERIMKIAEFNERTLKDIWERRN